MGRGDLGLFAFRSFSEVHLILIFQNFWIFLRVLPAALAAWSSGRTGYCFCDFLLLVSLPELISSLTSGTPLGDLRNPLRVPRAPLGNHRP